MPYYPPIYSSGYPRYPGGPAGGSITLPNGTVIPTCNGIRIIPRG